MSYTPARTALMVAPVRFYFNTESAASNSFQSDRTDLSEDLIQQNVREEFNALAEKMRSCGIEILQFEDTAEPSTPDSIFPNNWFSTHLNGDLFIYPMAIANRRLERRSDIIDKLQQLNSYELIDLTGYESLTDPLFLEGTGSMVIDHANQVVYAARSPRTSDELVTLFAKRTGMQAVLFDAFGKDGEAVYHTNVILCIGKDFAAIGSDTIAEYDRQRVLQSLYNSGKELIELTSDQVYEHFAGNMLQMSNASGESILVMSESAYQSLLPSQLDRLKAHNDRVLFSAIPTIESIGGGSVRCMIAEIFPRQ